MKRFSLVLLLFLFGVTATLYATLWNAPPLTWDDNSNIFGNPYFVMHLWWGVWTDPYFGLYVPVISSLWAGLYSLGQGDAWPYRAANIVMHLLNCGLVYGLLRALARRWNFANPIVVSLSVAVFALHPLQAGAVAWISGGRDLLATGLALAAVCVYFANRGRVGYVLSLVLFVLALLSKPSVVVLPVVIGMCDIKLMGRSLKGALVRMLPWFAGSMLAVIVTYAAQLAHFVDAVDWCLRPWVVLDTYQFYLQKIFWPWPLSGNYARTPDWVVADFQRLWFTLGFWLPTGFIIWSWRRTRWLFGIWALLLLPVSGLVPFGYQQISGVADHYNYASMIPLSIVAMVGLQQLLQSGVRHKDVLAYGISAVAIGLWIFVVTLRLPVWTSDRNFFSDMAVTAPSAYSTAIGMSVVLCDQSQEYEKGVEWTEKALAARPNDILALANRAYCLLHAGHNRAVIEMEYYLDKIDVERLALEQPTGYSSFLASIGSAMIQENELQAGYQYLCEAYKVKPSEPNHARNLEVATEILKKHGLEPSCDHDSE